jgi:hypothetical protein
VALDHHAHDAMVAGGDLVGDLGDDAGLALVLLAAVAVAGVDHQARGEAGALELGRRPGDAGGIVVGRLAAA